MDAHIECMASDVLLTGFSVFEGRLYLVDDSMLSRYKFSTFVRAHGVLRRNVKLD